ncbi:MAG: squalene/phytoene synthase family protein, partial [Candidatus Diapherotrites archaeon]|nr:squalene/phytoene synthase family protein [Candidatus Diapherotrites archaeon]
LDSIEDSTMSAKQKAAAFKRFVKIVRTLDREGLTALGAEILPFVPVAADREMVAGFGPVLSEFASFDERSRRIAVRWMATMASGMDRFSVKRIKTFKELDAYCYYVAGTVGHYLTDIFAYKFGLKHMAAFRKRCVDFGLLLQKTNIIRDFSRDFSEGRVFWPSELFERHGVSEQEALSAQSATKTQAMLSEMVVDARKHIVATEEYLDTIPPELTGLREFCAIPLYMAIPTLEKCADNPAVFDPNARVKLSRTETAEILVRIQQGF